MGLSISLIGVIIGVGFPYLGGVFFSPLGLGLQICIPLETLPNFEVFESGGTCLSYRWVFFLPTSLDHF